MVSARWFESDHWICRHLLRLLLISLDVYINRTLLYWMMFTKLSFVSNKKLWLCYKGFSRSTMPIYRLQSSPSYRKGLVINYFICWDQTKQMVKINFSLCSYQVLFVYWMEFDQTRWSCPWNSDKDCTQNSARGCWGSSGWSSLISDPKSNH